MTASDYAAWWGAGVATIVLAWDIIKWARTGPKVIVTATANMSALSRDKKLSGDKNVFVEAINTGDRLVTLTHLVTYRYKSKIHFFFGKRTGDIGIIPDPGTNQRLPYELGPGQRWAGLIDQDDLNSKLSPGLTYCGVFYSGRKKPILQLVDFKIMSSN